MDHTGFLEERDWLGTYYSSPVAADGKIYLANEDGKTVALKAGAQWEILSVGTFESGIKATRAITGGRIYFAHT